MSVYYGFYCLILFKLPIFWVVCAIHSPRKEGEANLDKLCVSERRTRILDYLSYRKSSTIKALSVEFCVSINTIVRDIDYISSFAPVYTKQGHNGGVFILPQYRSYKNYLTDKEEQCIERLMKTASEDDKYILEGIRIRFSKNAE